MMNLPVVWQASQRQPCQLLWVSQLCSRVIQPWSTAGENQNDMKRA